ncbi:MAG: cell division protein ZapE [Nitrosomonadales bacterium]|nr:cell division protein ZapE [Nitrosomonadales bacterium]
MNKHTEAFSSEAENNPKDWCSKACAEQGIIPDEAQAAAIGRLHDIWQQLMLFKSRRDSFLGRSLLSPEVPKGLYLWGGVGRGKTFLMDSFFHCLPYRRKRRIHFHEFMAEVHREMKLHAHHPDPLIAVADAIEKSTRVLCLDEFHVDDIADAMILGRLLAALFERGVILLTTSNYPPDELYPHGLQRERFLPAIALLKRELNQVHIDSGHDYRLLQMARESMFFVPADAHNERRMRSMFQHLAKNDPVTGVLQLKHQGIPVIGCEREAVWFDFKTLCGGNHDQSEYLEIAHLYSTVFLSGIPLLGHDNGAEARRFIWLIDVLYDHHIKLVASAAAMPDRLFTDMHYSNDSLRTASRLAEMQTRRYLDLMHVADVVTLS